LYIQKINVSILVFDLILFRSLASAEKAEIDVAKVEDERDTS